MLRKKCESKLSNMPTWPCPNQQEQPSITSPGRIFFFNKKKRIMRRNLGQTWGMTSASTTDT